MGFLDWFFDRYFFPKAFVLIVGGALIVERTITLSRPGNNHCHQSNSQNVSSYEGVNLLEKLADTNKDDNLCHHELRKMYRMCGVADKPNGYFLTSDDIERGIKNYRGGK